MNTGSMNAGSMNAGYRGTTVPAAVAEETRQYATFRVADLLLAIEVVKVQEVLRYQEMTMVPLASIAVVGLINLRGVIVVAIDLRRSLGLPHFEKPPMNIVLQTPDGVVSLLVDEVGDVTDVPLDRYALVPDNMPAEQRALFECVYDLDDGLLLVLDTTEVLDRACH